MKHMYGNAILLSAVLFGAVMASGAEPTKNEPGKPAAVKPAKKAKPAKKELTPEEKKKRAEQRKLQQKQREERRMKRVTDCGMTRETWKEGKSKLLYCQGVYGKDQPGKFGLVLFFHGAGERGSDNAAQLTHGIEPMVKHIRANKLKMIVLAPQCPGRKQWVDTPWGAPSHVIPEKPSVSMDLAMKLLDAKIKEFGTDTNRIYVSGISMGGYGTWDIVSRRPDFFAAAFPVCGGADLAIAPKLLNLPLRFYHGSNDKVVPTERSRNMADALKKAGHTKFTYVEIPKCGHNAWDKAYGTDDNFKWLFSQVKGLPAK